MSRAGDKVQRIARHHSRRDTAALCERYGTKRSCLCRKMWRVRCVHGSLGIRSKDHLAGRIVATKIFINYRRADTQAMARLIHNSLRQAFGRNNVFMDVDNIRAGEKFADHLNAQVEKCDIFLSLIGPNWLDARDEDGTRRLDNPNDYVRREIAAALPRKIRSVPILLDGTKLPKEAQLPDDLKSLASYHAFEIRNSQFPRDMRALIEDLRARKKTSLSRFGALALGAVLVAGVGWLLLQQLTQLTLVEQPKLTLEIKPAATGAPAPTTQPAPTPNDAEPRLMTATPTSTTSHGVGAPFPSTQPAPAPTTQPAPTPNNAEPRLMTATPTSTTSHGVGAPIPSTQPAPAPAPTTQPAPAPSSKATPPSPPAPPPTDHDPPGTHFGVMLARINPEWEGTWLIKSGRFAGTKIELKKTFDGDFSTSSPFFGSGIITYWDSRMSFEGADCSYVLKEEPGYVMQWQLHKRVGGFNCIDTLEIKKAR